MSEPIKVGDVVMIVRWPHACQGGKYLGRVYTVHFLFDHSTCSRCNHTFWQTVGALDVEGPGVGAVPLAWLKKIPPLDEIQRDRLTDEVRT